VHAAHQDGDGAGAECAAPGPQQREDSGDGS